MKKRILIIEDDPFLSDIYFTKLTSEDFEVKVAENGKKGLKMLESEKFDLLILDLILPEIDGFEVLERLRKDEKFKDLKIIILSNLGQKEEVEKGAYLGADRYFIKAYYTPTEVANEIKKILT